jgi:deoxyribose-phosphate aldolase
VTATSATRDPASADLAGRIQHTLIASTVTEDRLRAHCEECVEYGLNAAMVSPAWVPLARRILAGTPVAVASAVDFPPGAMSTAGKAAAARALADAGVQQVDIGTHVGFLLSGRYDEYGEDIAAVVRAVAPIPVKVMLELPLLPDPADRLRAVDLAVRAGAAYLKNASSGAVGPATVEDIAFLRGAAPDTVRVKASGGIHTREQVESLLAAGADLVGTSDGAAIVAGRTLRTTAY